MSNEIAGEPVEDRCEEWACICRDAGYHCGVEFAHNEVGAWKSADVHAHRRKSLFVECISDYHQAMREKVQNWFKTAQEVLEWVREQIRE